MKGVSAVIAVILILMIVVAMAAMVWVWMSGMMADITESTGETIGNTVDSMSKNFAIDSAACISSALEFTIRNTGSGVLDPSQVNAYVNGAIQSSLTFTSGDIATGATRTYTGGSCSVGDTLRVTIENGVSMSKTLQ